MLCININQYDDNLNNDNKFNFLRESYIVFQYL